MSDIPIRSRALFGVGLVFLGLLGAPFLRAATAAEVPAAAPPALAQNVTVLGPFDSAARGVPLLVSATPNGARASWILDDGEKYHVVVDGVAGPACDEIAEPGPIFSSDGRHLAYAARQGTAWKVFLDGVPGQAFDNVAGLAFSPEAGHEVYFAQKNKKWAVVWDDQAKYDFAWSEIKTAQSRFSPDGQNLAFPATQDGVNWVLSVEGQLLTMSAGVTAHYIGEFGASIILPSADFSTPVFSPDNEHYAIIENLNGNYRVDFHGATLASVVDTIGWMSLHPDFDAVSDPVFSADSQDFAYLATKDGKMFFVLDQQPGPAFDRILTFLFSPTGARSAYVAIKDGKMLAVVGGRPGPAFDAITPPVFSQDGRRVVYTAVVGDKFEIVTDGVAGPAFDRVGDPVRSPDGQQVMYWGQNGDRRRMFLNGQPLGPDMDNVYVQIFSRDGRHTAFSARDNLKWRMVVDGQAGPEFSDVDDPHFSADGRHVAYKAQTGDNYFVMRDGKPDPTMEVVNGGSLQFSPDGASLAYAAQSSGRWNVVVDGVPGPAFDDVDLLHYSPDGRHLAYVATDSAQPLFLIAGTPIDESLRDVGPIIDPASPAPGYRTLDGNRVRVVVDRQPGPSFDFVLTAPVVCRDGRLEYLAVKRTAGGARQLVRVTIPGFAPAQT